MFAGQSAMASGSAHTLTVTGLNDTVGSCSGSGLSLNCPTLRTAIAQANLQSGSTIQFQSGLTGTIYLTSTLPAISQSVTITGPGANTLTISGNSSYQILNISSGTVTISGLALANGKNSAILNSGALTLTNCTFSGNSGDYGGAIDSYGVLTLTNSTFSGNTAVNGGGAINANSTLNVTNSTFSGNSSTAPYNPNNGGYGGGAILSYDIALTITNSTFSQNSTGGWGSAIYADNGSSLTANNNIFVGNTASNVYGGAGIVAYVATSNVDHSFFYQNLNGNGTEADCVNCTSNTNAITGVNPNLLPLGYYGGPTETMLPQPGSPAICAGSYADVPNDVTTDQRGFLLTSSICGNGQVDIGAVQTNYVQVTNTNDSGAGSLRAAITAANGTSYGGDIDFASSVTGTITLQSALPMINQSMAIMGPGASAISISGDNAYQVLNITSGAATIYGLTLVNGSSSGSGGAIENSSTLAVFNSSFSGNSAIDFGGAIANSGTLVVIGSTFSGNYASSNGGAISNTAALTVTNSTFSGNSGGYQAAGGAGAIFNSGTLTVTHSTFSGNSGNYGGAIYNDGSLVNIDNSIIAGNSSHYGSGAGILSNAGTVNNSYNLYYQNLDGGATEDDCNNCTTNTNAIASSNPLLTALGNYGGPMQTLLPEPGSPAICAGSMSLIPSGVTTDQRGFSRTTTYNGIVCVDLGAVQTDYTAVAFSSSSYSGVAHQNVNPAPVVTVTENGQNIGGVPITLGYSGTGSPTGLGPVTTVSGVGASFTSLAAATAAQGTMSVDLPITASGNAVQPAALTASASLNIQAATQTISFVTSSPVTYGLAPITLTATGGGSGNPVTFSLDAASTAGVATLSGNSLTITGVGTVVIDANQAAGTGYLAAAQVQQSIVVNPATVTIAASSPTVVYGEAVPTITPSFNGFMNGDTRTALTEQPTCVTAYTATSAVGSSPATSCSGAAAANYTFAYANGTVTVTPVPTFVVAGSSTSLTIAPGAATGNTVPISVTPSNGFTGTVSLSCSISPVAASHPVTCSLSPTSVTISGTTPQTSTLTILTTAASVGENRMERLLWPAGGTTLALVMLIGVPRRRRSWLAMAAVLALFVSVGAAGCGGGSGNGGSGNSGTTAGAYTVTVTGTSGAVTGTVGTVSLTVQ